MNDKLLALYGLAFNPFSPDVPTEALHLTPPVESFFWKVQQGLLREGGFALITGEPGTGKSVTLRLLSQRLAQEPELVVGVISRPQASVADFYREMGELFGVPLRPHNRWSGSKVLRQRWDEHIEQTLMRPVLLVDEAQQTSVAVLNELRFLGSSRFDSRQILTVVLSGDMRLPERFRHEDLLPLGSRIRMRLRLEPASTEQLRTALKHLICAAGNSALMTPDLIATLSEHALGNYRVLMTLSGELLAAAAEKELPQIDEKLYFELFSIHRPAKPRSAAGGRT
ncbi:MAG: AAA family ATPase [Chloroflexota bacterium]|nr:AAA family ATPase [Chloroflexota bacterium]